MALKQLTTERLKSTVTSNDRMSLTMFLAFAFHLLLVLGISFSIPKNQPPLTRNLDITLVQSSTDQKNKYADFVANETQLGSGNTKDKGQLTHQMNVKAEDSSKGGSTQEKKESSTEKQEKGKDNVLVQDDKANLTITNKANQDKVQDTENVAKTELIQSSRDKNVIKDEIERILKITTKRKLSRKIVSASTEKHKDASYIKKFENRVGRISNSLFTGKTKKSGVYGSYVVIEVEITKRGVLRRVKVIKTSGSKLLDEHMKRSIRLGQPYFKVPPEILQNKDLYVIRTRYRLR